MILRFVGWWIKRADDRTLLDTLAVAQQELVRRAPSVIEVKRLMRKACPMLDLSVVDRLEGALQSVFNEISPPTGGVP